MANRFWALGLASCIAVSLAGPGDPAPRTWPQPLSASYGDGELVVGLADRLPPGLLRWHRGVADAGPVLRRALARFEARTGLDTSGFTLAVERLADEALVDRVDEGYEVTVNSTGVLVGAKTVWGARHGLDSLAQLVGYGGRIRHAKVADEPQYAYRGLMISPGQRFMTTEVSWPLG